MKDNKREISIVRSSAAIQFRKWANHIIEEYTVKGFDMDDDRLKDFGTLA